MHLRACVPVDQERSFLWLSRRPVAQRQPDPDRRDAHGPLGGMAVGKGRRVGLRPSGCLSMGGFLRPMQRMLEVPAS